jgi:lipoprotein-releasing system ATP-binding protein
MPELGAPEAPLAPPVLHLEGVSKDYGDAVVTRVLRGIDLDIRRGELATLIGPSGSGKSTLLNLLGLLDRPTGGRIVVAGRDTADLDDEDLTRLRGETLGFVFQFHHLLPAFTALENVMLPAWAGEGYPSPAMRDRALGLLEAVGLADKAKRKPSALSGGEQQRVAIARALMREPILLLADEPSGNLDTGTADEVFALLARINAERGLTSLIVTHDPRVAARASRVIELVDGRIVRDGPPDRVGDHRER